MRTFIQISLTVAVSTCLSAPAIAADLTGDEITKMFSGKTVYTDFGATSLGGAGQGAIYYAADGTSLYKTAKGPLWHGKWSVKGNTLCNDWKESPGNPCSRYDKQGDKVSIINAATGVARGTIAKVVDGNPEKLAP